MPLSRGASSSSRGRRAPEEKLAHGHQGRGLPTALGRHLGHMSLGNGSEVAWRPAQGPSSCSAEGFRSASAAEELIEKHPHVPPGAPISFLIVLEGIHPVGIGAWVGEAVPGARVDDHLPVPSC